MSRKYIGVTAIGAALLLTACGASVQDRLEVTRNAGLWPLGKSQAASAAEAPKAIPVSWDVRTSPVTIAPEGAKAASKVGGHAVLQAAPHAIPKRYQVSWSGLRDTHDATPTRLTLRDTSGNRAIVLQFEKDRLRVINGAEDPYPHLTFSKTETHHVTLVVTTGARPTVAIDVRQGKIPLYATPPIAVLDKDFNGVGALEIEAAAEGTTYHITDFQAVPTKS